MAMEKLEEGSSNKKGSLVSLSFVACSSSLVSSVGSLNKRGGSVGGGSSSAMIPELDNLRIVRCAMCDVCVIECRAETIGVLVIGDIDYLRSN